MITHARVPTHVALTLLIKEPFSQGMVFLLVTGYWLLVTGNNVPRACACTMCLVPCALCLDWDWIGLAHALDWDWVAFGLGLGLGLGLVIWFIYRHPEQAILG